MAKKKVAKEYIVLIGCNTADETRYEVGDLMSGVTESEINALLEMGAIKEQECQ